MLDIAAFCLFSTVSNGISCLTCGSGSNAMLSVHAYFAGTENQSYNIVNIKWML